MIPMNGQQYGQGIPNSMRGGQRSAAPAQAAAPVATAAIPTAQAAPNAMAYQNAAPQAAFNQSPQAMGSAMQLPAQANPQALANALQPGINQQLQAARGGQVV